MKNIITYILTIAVLSACEPIEQPKVHVYTQRDTIFVTAKTIEHISSNFWGKGYDKYVIAFSNRETKTCNFSEYDCFQIGDTLIGEKLNTEHFWNWNYRCK